MTRCARICAGACILVAAGARLAAADDGPGAGCDLTGVGSLTVRSNADGASVLVDGKVKKLVSGGRATIILPEGAHVVAVEEEGFTRAEATVTITSCEISKEMLILDPLPVVKPAHRGNVWRPIFAASLAAEIGIIGFSYYAYARRQDEVSLITAMKITGVGPLSEADCGDPKNIIDDKGGHFASACDWNRRHIIGGYLALGVGAFVIVSAYLAFRHQPDSRKVVGLVPVVTPELAGAQLSLAW